MIQAQDVKLKNSIYRVFKTHKQIVEVCSLIENEINFRPSEEFEPIPLTPEILEKCGKYNSTDDYWDIEGFKLWHDGKGFYHINSELLFHIDYLHQLQNAFYILTSKELNYKP